MLSGLLGQVQMNEHLRLPLLELRNSSQNLLNVIMMQLLLLRHFLHLQLILAKRLHFVMKKAQNLSDVHCLILLPNQILFVQFLRGFRSCLSLVTLLFRNYSLQIPILRYVQIVEDDTLIAVVMHQGRDKIKGPIQYQQCPSGLSIIDSALVLPCMVVKLLQLLVHIGSHLFSND